MPKPKPSFTPTVLAPDSLVETAIYPRKKPVPWKAPGDFKLGDLSTRELLAWLAVARHYKGGVDPTFPEPYDGKGKHITVEEIKAILATRPHVPRGSEARQAKAGNVKKRRAKKASRRKAGKP